MYNAWGHNFRRNDYTWKSFVSSSNVDKNWYNKLFDIVWNYFPAHSYQGLL
jgi:hypothetical protein